MNAESDVWFCCAKTFVFATPQLECRNLDLPPMLDHRVQSSASRSQVIVE